ncbi:MAG: gliding motility lipoprotein GldK [Flavobacteriaceae bacterium]|nr:gliding motility lipoprotein GldK [Flavobacteriaceae bacterium]
MKKIFLFIAVAITFGSCSKFSNSNGELVGVKSSGKWYSKRPMGMVLIPSGSFSMGRQNEDMAGTSFNAPIRTVTVRNFYMDETEITNSEYKQFVHWTRDSIVRTQLAVYADLMSTGDKKVLEKYQFVSADTTKMTNYQKYMMENYGTLADPNSPTEGKMLNWEEELIWDINEFPSIEYAEVMADSVYLPIDENLGGRRMIDVKKLQYRFRTLDKNRAARAKGKSRKEYVREDVVRVYPDTTAWVRDFSYSYNDPMHQDYFYHPAYNDYPVVGVSWWQAKAFCNWRTKIKNDALSGKKNISRVPQFRLPTEAEWEYAARGGIKNAEYPWGGPDLINDRGCFLANFKPVRGDYAVDGALYTIEVKSYKPNDYGLYDMAGNVSEWTNTTYNETSYYIASTMNPTIEDGSNLRKVIRGGSWKDTGYFLEVSTRDYEYADTARSYIGFRTVQDYLGVKK